MNKENRMYIYVILYFFSGFVYGKFFDIQTALFVWTLVLVFWIFKISKRMKQNE